MWSLKEKIYFLPDRPFLFCLLFYYLEGHFFVVPIFGIHSLFDVFFTENCLTRELVDHIRMNFYVEFYISQLLTIFFKIYIGFNVCQYLEK